MMEEVMISVIVPVYNSEKYLMRCLKSIKEQTYCNYEVFLINDGSTDRSACICKKYADEDTRVYYLEQENMGVAKTRNKGINLAKGKYVVFLDNDDYINKDFFKIVAEHDNEDADILIFEYRNVETEKKIEFYKERLSEVTSEVYRLNNKNEYLQKELLCPRDEKLKKMSIVYPWGKAYKRCFLTENKIAFDSRIKLCEDVYMNLIAYEKAEKVVCINYPAYFYYTNIESAGRGYNPNVVAIEKNNIKVLNKLLEEKLKNKDFAYAYDNCLCFRYWSCCFSYFIHPNNTCSNKRIVEEMKEFERETKIRKAFKSLVGLRKSMEIKEWIFLMFVKYRLYSIIVLLARYKMKKKRRQA